MDGEILEAEQKMYSSFCRACGFIANTVSEVMQIMHENGLVVLLHMLPEFAKMVQSWQWYLLCSSAERVFSALHRLKTYLRSTMGQQRVSNVAIIYIERACQLCIRKWDRTSLSFVVLVVCSFAFSVCLLLYILVVLPYWRIKEYIKRFQLAIYWQ